MNKCNCCGKYTINLKYCSRSCAGKINNSKYPKKKGKPKANCLWCGIKVGKNASTYCSRNCQHIANYHIFINKWKLDLVAGTKGLQVSKHIRIYLFEKHDHRCQECGWNEKNLVTGNIPLQVHHIDGNSKNNKEVNLELLCPNCHSLTDNFGRIKGITV